MSVINLTFDTKEKSMSVSLDGRRLSNVRAVNFYNYYADEGFAAEIVQVDVDEDNQMSKTEITRADK